MCFTFGRKMKRNNTPKTFPWGLLITVSVVFIAIGGIGLFFSNVQMIGTDKYSIAQGSGFMTPQEAAQAIASKRRPQMAWYTILFSVGFVSTFVSTIGFVATRLSRKKNAEQAAP
jgi:tetrahydromethanopterin S-methyltransferase subunit D